MSVPDPREITPPSPRRWFRLGRAAAWTYAPQLAAFVLSPVTECSHCVATFWGFFLILPGFIPLVLFPLPALLRWTAAVAMTLVVVWGHDALQDRTRFMLVARLALAALTALNAIAFGNLIRM